MRDGATDEEMIEIIKGVWMKRADRYSEQRLESMRSPEGYKPKVKKIEMITLGG
jgi:cyclic pyranopterin phosphate synthase